MIVILDNIRSNYNVGSIFRTADAASVSKLYLCGYTPGPFDRFGRTNTALTKVSLGAEKTVQWEHADSVETVLDKLRRARYTIGALEQHANSISLFDSARFARTGPGSTIALIIGNEVEGISGDILDQCDVILEIPMRGAKESLNVSVAFGIAAYVLNNT